MTDGGPFYRINLPESVVKPAEDVFLFEKAEEKKQAESIISAFQNALGEVQLPVLTVEEVTAYVRGEGVSAKVLAVIEEVLEQVL